MSNLSVLGGEEPWGGGPWGGNQGAVLHLVGAPHGGVGVLHGVVGVPLGASLVEEAQGGVLIQGLVLGPERRRRRQQQRQQLAAPSAASPSSQRISAAPCGTPAAQ